MEAKSPLVSAVILSWNGGNHLESCVEHVLAQTYHNLELIIVDNGSTDGSLERVQPLLGGARIVRNTTNLGYARGMNQGIELAQGEFVLLLNQDAFIAPDFIEWGVEALSDDKGIGMVAARVLAIHDGHKTNSVIGAGTFLRKRMKPIVNTNGQAFEVLGPVWCSAFLRRATLEDVRCSVYEDYLDEDFFAYHEDVDFNLRAALRGWTCRYVPAMVVWHRVSGSFGGQKQLIARPPKFRQHSLKNRYLTTIKDLPTGLLLRWSVYLLVAEVGLWVYLATRSPSTLKDLLRAYKDIVRLLPKAIRRRRAIQCRRRIPTSRLTSFFVGF